MIHNLQHMLLLALLLLVFNSPCLAGGTEKEKAIQKLEKNGCKVLRDETAPGRPVIGLHVHTLERYSSLEARLKEYRSSFKKLQEFKLNILPGRSTKTFLKRYVTDNLVGYKELRRLTLYGVELSDPELILVCRLKKLQSLIFWNTDITDAGLDYLIDLKDLRRLELPSQKITDDGLVFLTKLQNLEHLKLTTKKLTNAGMKHFAKLQDLRHLDFNANKITVLGLIHLLKLKKIQQLHLRDLLITDQFLKHLSKLDQLQRLDLQANPISDNGLLYLQKLQQLRNLDLSYCKKITDEGLQHLSGLPKLEDLDLSGCPITDAGMKHLVKLPQLKKLKLMSTKVTDTGLNQLAQVKQLRILHLSKKQVTEAELVKIEKALPNCRITVFAEPIRPVLNPQVEKAVNKGLMWLAEQQNGDGSWSEKYFDHDTGVTSLAMLAFMANGHYPGRGKYGDLLGKAEQFLLKSSNQNGLLFQMRKKRRPTMYQHGLATHALAKCYSVSQNQNIKPVLEKAVKLIAKSQSPVGGWRYHPQPRQDGDLSITIIQLLALHAATDAKIKVPEEVFTKANKFVDSCYFKQSGGFTYFPKSRRPYFSNTAMGMLAYQLAGKKVPALCFDFLQNRSNQGTWFLFGHYYSAQVMRRKGGPEFEKWYGKVLKMIMKDQLQDGSWERIRHHRRFGPVLTTSLVVSILTQAPQKE